MNAITDLPIEAEQKTGLFSLPNQLPHERVLFVADRHSGLQAVLAVHSTARGPGFGGCRLWHYGSQEQALTDALRLSHGMSLKNALADLPFGGGKAVIIKPQGDFPRKTLFEAFGDAVESLGGRYITAEDVGTTTDDMRTVAQRTSHVSGIPRAGAFGGDPSPKTAWGVFVSIRMAVREHLGHESLHGIHVAIQGLGAVGWTLAAYLHEAGARLTVADVDPAKLERARAELDAKVVNVDEILAVSCDVLAPCALGASLNSLSIPKLQARIVAGAANNQLATVEDGDALHARGVLYLPDYLVNAGGIISVAREFRGEGQEAAVMAEVTRIEERVQQLMQRVADGEGTPARIADAWAASKLTQAV